MRISIYENRNNMWYFNTFCINFFLKIFNNSFFCSNFQNFHAQNDRNTLTTEIELTDYFYLNSQILDGKEIVHWQREKHTHKEKRKERAFCIYPFFLWRAFFRLFLWMIVCGSPVLRSVLTSACWVGLSKHGNTCSTNNRPDVRSAKRQWLAGL